MNYFTLLNSNLTLTISTISYEKKKMFFICWHEVDNIKKWNRFGNVFGIIRKT